MFGNSKKKKGVRITTHIDSLIGKNTFINGNIEFSGGLRIDGNVTGNIGSVSNDDSVLTLSENGLITGEIKVPNMIINGEIRGDIYADGHIELVDKANITGNVFYHQIEMAVGAEVNGKLIRMSSDINGETIYEDQDLTLEQNNISLEQKS
ncbi:MAG TPA: cell shape determination protein CcmA [Gammaproteobacteria bacterium]|nr:cell shape determination protein CcmA [Gammaproteobacteria bacterium]